VPARVERPELVGVAGVRLCVADQEHLHPRIVSVRETDERLGEDNRAV
jgi:hypothetical protein